MTDAHPTSLVAFLHEQHTVERRHAEKDLAVAGQATPGPWRAKYGVGTPISEVHVADQPLARLAGGRHGANAFMIARFQPANVRGRAARRIAELDALAAVITAHTREPHYCPIPVATGDHGQLWTADEGPCWTLRLLAYPYANKPGYRAGEWGTVPADAGH
jgi:Family of unknown function (DUF6221)